MTSVTRDGYLRAGVKRGGTTLLHKQKVQRVLGKRLPKKAVIHHIDGNPANNENTNLVVCPDQAYHKLLHYREEALRISGNANNVRCSFCKQYDSRENVTQVSQRTDFYHKACYAKFRREQRVNLDGKV